MDYPLQRPYTNEPPYILNKHIIQEVMCNNTNASQAAVSLLVKTVFRSRDELCCFGRRNAGTDLARACHAHMCESYTRR